jgi:membrane protein DedA with SNARE-associated domain
MSYNAQTLVEHGYITIFIASLVERLGIPVFTTPVVVGAGLLAASGKLSLALVIAITVFATLLGDWVWFELGRRRGNKVVGLLCRISLSRDSCVERTKKFSKKHSDLSLLYTKFVPGVSHISPPLAGLSGTSLARFTAFNFAGTLLWASALAISGWASMRPLESARIASYVLATPPVLILVFIIGNLIWKYVQKQRFIRSLRMERLSAKQLAERLESEDKPLVIDLRHPLDVLHDPRGIPGAINVLPEDIEAKAKELPLEREFIIVCT